MIGVLDNLKTCVLFRMLDLLLQILAWRSAPRVKGESSLLKKGMDQTKLLMKKVGQKLGKAMEETGAVSKAIIHGKVLSVKALTSKLGENDVQHTGDVASFLPTENLLTLSPQLVVKALTKAPLVDLLQIFSDCTLDEREHILSALRSAPLLGPEPTTSGSSLIFSRDPAPIIAAGETSSLGCKGATLAGDQMPDLLNLWPEQEALSPYLQGASPLNSGAPPGSQSLSPRALDDPPDAGWDDHNPFTQLLIPKKKPVSDNESGMGIDREAFLKWVDPEREGAGSHLDEWLAPLPLFEDLPKAPPSRELRSFVMGRDGLTEDEPECDRDLPPLSHTEGPSLPIASHPDEPPTRQLRSLPPDTPAQRTIIKPLRERPDDWDEFQPLYNELNMIQKRFRSPDPYPLNRVGASPQLDPHAVWLTKSGPPPGGGAERYTPPWSSPGRGSPPGRYSSGGPPPVPLPRRGRRLSSPKSRIPRDSGRVTERPLSGPG